MSWYALNLNQITSASDKKARLHKAKNENGCFSFWTKNCNPGNQLTGSKGIIFFEAKDDKEAESSAKDFVRRLFDNENQVKKCSYCFSNTNS